MAPAYHGVIFQLEDIVVLFECLNAFFTSDHQTLQSIQGQALIMTSNKHREKSLQLKPGTF